MQLNNALNGLIRLSALHRTRLMETHHTADIVMMCRLALLDKFLLVDEPLFYRRIEAATATALQGADAVRRQHYPTLTFRALFQRWKRQTGWFRAALAAPTPVSDRLRAVVWAARRGDWEREGLYADLREAWHYTRQTRAQATRGAGRSP